MFTRVPQVPLVLLTAALLGTTGWAAVLPYADPLAPPASMRAGLLAPVSADLAGEWVGRTPDGRFVAVTLRIDSGMVQGDAALGGMMPDAQGRRPLLTTAAKGRSISFAVRATPCAKTVAHGVLTMVSRRSAHLSLHAGSAPITVQLSRVG